MGEKFYLIQEGEAIAVKRGDNGVEKQVFEYKGSGYFGELALIKNENR